MRYLENLNLDDDAHEKYCDISYVNFFFFHLHAKNMPQSKGKYSYVLLQHLVIVRGIVRLTVQYSSYQTMNFLISGHNSYYRYAAAEYIAAPPSLGPHTGTLLQ